MAHAVTRSLSNESTTSNCSSSSSSSSCSNKSVQFSRFIKISFTYPEDEYDRTAFEPAKLTFSEASELLQLRIHWKNEMNSRLEALEQEQQKKIDPIDTTPDMYSKNQQHENDEATVPSMSPSSSCSSSACSSPEQEHPPQRFRTPHRLLSISSSCVSLPCAHSSPPCSPVLSHHDSCSSSEDEYETMVPRLQKLGRLSADENDSGLMYRYSQYGVNKDSVCLA
ncbi:hypothetical protein BGZ52_001622 [Haplosporangium bisporale]|nr:hypothetical protein BGZ52_001622 [Haplosporangium bisporale]KAF9210793.1 hypothetical protein BGZ59_008921 [Podila verticillata]KAI9242592.1 MAG: hypothetical protein BYD32DRAFT_402830 [Podila humilis]KFH67466.1 hypothetical protein MVEG_06198 [Podila verticillata NRRL 6337]